MTEPEVDGHPPDAAMRAHLEREFSRAAVNFSAPRHLPPPPQVTEVKVLLPRVASHACAGFAMFATWWLIGLITIPIVDGNRLSWIHVVVGGLGLPIVGWLWWTTWRVSVEASWQPRERLREPRSK